MSTRDLDANSRLGSFARRSNRLARAGLMLAPLLIAVACGGGGGGAAPEPAVSTPPPATPPLAPVARGTVIVRATTTSGDPVAGAYIDINEGGHGRSATSGASGDVQFERVPAGEANTVMGAPGYHPASKRFVVAAETITTVSVILEKAAEATPVILASRATPSQDGTTLALDLDVAVLDQDGTVRETLTASDFSLEGACDWYSCIVDEYYRDLAQWYVAQVQSAVLVPTPLAARPALAIALLLDQSAGTANFDAAGARIDAVSQFLTSVNPPDGVAIGSYQGSPAVPVLTTFGGFTSDTTDLRNRIGALSGNEGGTSAYYRATSEMIAFTEANAPRGAVDRQRAVVVVTTNWPDPQCVGPAACKAANDSIAAAGIPIYSVGTDGPASVIAIRTGGAAAYVQHPAQLPSVFRRLSDIVGERLPYHRVRLQLESDAGTFLRKGSVGGYLSVRIGPDTVLSWWVELPF